MAPRGRPGTGPARPRTRETAVSGDQPPPPGWVPPTPPPPGSPPPGQPGPTPGWGTPPPPAGAPRAGTPAAGSGWEQVHPGGQPGGHPAPGYHMPYPIQPAPAAHKPGAIPLRPLVLGDIFDGAFRIIRYNPKATVGAAVLVSAVAMLVPIGAGLVSGSTGGLQPDPSTDTLSDSQVLSLLIGLGGL